MSERTVRSLAADRQIVAALAAGPMTADELAHVMRMEILDSWTEAQGVEVEWGTARGKGPNEPVGARLLAICSCEERGLIHFHGYELQRRLPAMERRGLVQRIQIPGKRPMLWSLAARSPSRTERGEG